VRGLQADVRRASFRSAFERVRPGAVRITANALDDAELLAARLRIHEHDIPSRFRRGSRLTRRNDATEENGG